MLRRTKTYREQGVVGNRSTKSRGWDGKTLGKSSSPVWGLRGRTGGRGSRDQNM